MKTLNYFLSLVVALVFISCNANYGEPWARIGIETANGESLFRNIPKQFWISAPEGEEIFVRANGGSFIVDGKEIDAIKGFTVNGIGKDKRLFYDIINTEREDIKIDVSYPGTGTNSLQLKDAVNPDYIELPNGGTASVYSEVYNTDGGKNGYIRITVLGNNIASGEVLTCSFTANGYLSEKREDGILQGRTDIEFNKVSGIQQVLEPLYPRTDGLSMTYVRNLSVSIE